MSTILEICNSALIKLGVEPITSLDPLVDDSKAARLCAATYEMIRDDLLASHYWNFAMKRATLVVNATGPLYDYSYAYDLPADSLRIHSLSSSYPTRS